MKQYTPGPFQLALEQRVAAAKPASIIDAPIDDTNEYCVQGAVHSLNY